MTERTVFPPHDLTEDEEAALVGRYVECPEPQPAPPPTEAELADDNDYGRTPPAPYGVVYVNPDFIDAAVEAVEAAEAETAEPAGEPEEEAEAEPEAEPEPEPEPEEDAEEIDVESLTVPELHAQLDALGVEYERDDRKADLQQLLYDALEG